MACMNDQVPLPPAASSRALLSSELAEARTPWLIRACYLGSFKGVSKSVWVRLNGFLAVMVLTLIILKWRALFIDLRFYASCLEALKV